MPQPTVLSGRPRTSWGLSQFSSDENGTVPLAKVEVVAGRPLRSVAKQAAVAGLMLVILSGCGQPSPNVPEGQPESLPPAYLRSVISEPKLLRVAEEFQRWVQTANRSPKGRPLFSRTEVLPVAQTLLPYGVGVYQQEPRLPVILTTGAGWGELGAEQQEKFIAGIYEELAGRLERAGLDHPYRPTLTLQTPQGLLLAWINGMFPRERLLHGE